MVGDGVLNKRQGMRRRVAGEAPGAGGGGEGAWQREV